jgi:hypothetical protein
MMVDVVLPCQKYGRMIMAVVRRKKLYVRVTVKVVAVFLPPRVKYIVSSIKRAMMAQRNHARKILLPQEDAGVLKRACGCEARGSSKVVVVVDVSLESVRGNIFVLVNSARSTEEYEIGDAEVVE